MGRLSIELTSEQHKLIKAMAALEEKSIKDYVLGCVIPSVAGDDLSSEEAMKQLEALLSARIKEVKDGKIVTESVKSIFSESE